VKRRLIVSPFPSASFRRPALCREFFPLFQGRFGQDQLHSLSFCFPHSSRSAPSFLPCVLLTASCSRSLRFAELASLPDQFFYVPRLLFVDSRGDRTRSSRGSTSELSQALTAFFSLSSYGGPRFCRGFPFFCVRRPVPPTKSVRASLRSTIAVRIPPPFQSTSPISSSRGLPSVSVFASFFFRLKNGRAVRSCLLFFQRGGCFLSASSQTFSGPSCAPLPPPFC